MEMIIDKKQIWMIFLLKFKMGCKAETTCNTNNTCDQELITKIQCSGG